MRHKQPLKLHCACITFIFLFFLFLCNCPTFGDLELVYNLHFQYCGCRCRYIYIRCCCCWWRNWICTFICGGFQILRISYCCRNTFIRRRLYLWSVISKYILSFITVIIECRLGTTTTTTTNGRIIFRNHVTMTIYLWFPKKEIERENISLCGVSDARFCYVITETFEVLAIGQLFVIHNWRSLKMNDPMSC